MRQVGLTALRRHIVLGALVWTTHSPCVAEGTWRALISANSASPLQKECPSERGRTSSQTVVKSGSGLMEFTAMVGMSMSDARAARSPSGARFTQQVSFRQCCLRSLSALSLTRAPLPRGAGSGSRTSQCRGVFEGEGVPRKALEDFENYEINGNLRKTIPDPFCSGKFSYGPMRMIRNLRSCLGDRTN